MRLFAPILIGLVAILPVAASAQCLNEGMVRSLDANWDQALNEGSKDVIQQILHEDFVWIHNHAVSVQESKSNFLSYFDETFGRAINRSATMHPNSRIQREIKVILNNGTAVVYGITEVTRGRAPISEPDSRQPEIYHFMRTYVSSDAECQLVSNHTMRLGED